MMIKIIIIKQKYINKQITKYIKNYLYKCTQLNFPDQTGTVLAAR